MATVTIDTSEVDKFTAHLAGVGTRLNSVIAPVMKRAAQNVKNDLVTDFQGSSDRGIRAIARKVRYSDISGNQYGWRTKIGIDKGGAGSLGNIAVFGTYKGGGSHMHPAFYAAKEMPEFQRQVLIAVGGLI